jgi:cobalt/nickel transport protein
MEEIMRRFFTPGLCLLLVFGLVNVSQAHFGLIMPDKSMVMQGDNPELQVLVAFCHPFEQNAMVMERPKKFGVMAGKTNTDLTNTLQETKLLDKKAWKGVYAIKKPGIYTFYVDPQPYWEPAENQYIIHYTKTYIAALGYEEDWDQEVGLKAEIIPLTRPFALYTGNVFRGVAKFNGKPVPDADVEVEYWNPGKKVEAPNEYFVTLKVKTDKNGVFAFAPPKAGWWGFSAINDEKLSMTHDGKRVNAEHAGVLWVQVTDWPAAK